ncbi:SseB family protein [Actinoplanes flavus]|uniref:SseB family protein n=1 Tax=Actinoplanes flavus TaxID=2820290 RepID=A0ABS3UG36_9ACTN|nr:SseB family protein [Actinoplanes flavus]MBO3737745.1 SseB family protein [Actinoplanes flavus]
MTAWEPVNEVERAMLLAAGEDDRQSYFQLVALAELYLPQIAGDDSPGQRFLTVHAFDEVFLPVFTSVRALAAQFGHAVNGYTVTSYAELRRKWPDPQWRLAINPGTPIDAYLAVEGVERAAVGDVTVPTLAELAEEAEQDEIAEQELRALQAAGDHPVDDTAAALTAAARAGDVYGYLDHLLDAVVLIPADRPVTAEEIVEPGFPWLPGPDQMIEVFTTPEALAGRHPGSVPAVEVALPFALAVWPEGHGLAVDPGSDGAIEVSAEDVLVLLTFIPAGAPDGSASPDRPAGR